MPKTKASKTVAKSPKKEAVKAARKPAVKAAVKKAKPEQIKALMNVFWLATENDWSMQTTVAELKKLGLRESETCLVQAKSWFTWEDGSTFTHEDEWFKPYKIAPKQSVSLAKAALADNKDSWDYMAYLAAIAEAGGNHYKIDYRKGVVTIGHTSDDGKQKVLASTKVDVSPKGLRHAKYDELSAAFARFNPVSWPFDRVYGDLKDLGLAGFDFDNENLLTTYNWANGVRDIMDEGQFAQRKVKIAPGLDKKAVKKAFDYMHGKDVDYSKFLDKLAEAGVKSYSLSLDKKTITSTGGKPQTTATYKIDVK